MLNCETRLILKCNICEHYIPKPTNKGICCFNSTDVDKNIHINSFGGIRCAGFEYKTEKKPDCCEICGAGLGSSYYTLCGVCKGVVLCNECHTVYDFLASDSYGLPRPNSLRVLKALVTRARNSK